MMPDGIRTGVLGLTNLKVLEWISKLYEQTGEIGSNATAELKGLRFIRKGIKVFCKGSLHVFHNNGLHNYNDFTYDDLQAAIKNLCSALKIEPSMVPLEGFEFGVNLQIKDDPDKFLYSAILHKNQPFREFSERATKGKSATRVCKHSNFSIKIYNKGLQEKQPNYILRIEIDANRMEYFKQRGIGIHTLADLNLCNITKLKKLLLKTIEEILFCDQIFSEDISIPQKDLLVLLERQNHSYWTKTKPKSNNYKDGNQDPAYKCARTKYYRNISAFKSLLQKHNLNKNKEELISLISGKCIQLNRPANQKSVYNLTGTMEPQESLSCIQLNTESIVSDCSTCLVTGFDISMQKKGSRFLCTSGIKECMKNNPEGWATLLKRLSPKWQNASLEKQIEEIHQSIRNEYYNNKRNIKKIINRPSLFDTRPYICSAKMELAGL